MRRESASSPSTILLKFLKLFPCKLIGISNNSQNPAFLLASLCLLHCHQQHHSPRTSSNHVRPCLPTKSLSFEHSSHIFNDDSSYSITVHLHTPHLLSILWFCCSLLHLPNPPSTMVSVFPLSASVTRQIELRFAAKDLANKDFLSLSDPFLVCHTIRNGAPAERIGRTETVKDDLNPVWVTTICFTYDPNENSHTMLLIDIFDRDSPDDSSLTKHDFLGRATFRISELMRAPYRRLDLPLLSAKQILLGSSTTLSIVTNESKDLDSFRRNTSAHTTDVEGNVLRRRSTKDLKQATTTTRATKKLRGTVSIFAEELKPTQGMNVVFRVSSAMMRDSGPFGRRLTQFYEIQRERVEGDNVSWSCIYRSKDGVNVDRNNYVVFDDMSVTEQQLHNMDSHRNLRIAFYKRYTRQQHELISYINTSLEDIMTSRFKEGAATISMEGEFGDDEGLGHVIVKSVERWVETLGGESDSGTLAVNLRADHFLHKKFISSLNDAPKHGRRLRQLPSFITMH